MLVLARKVEQALMIGDDIEIRILAIDGDTVRIGIEAPRSMTILRRELYEQVKEENRRASVTTEIDTDALSRLL